MGSARRPDGPDERYADFQNARETPTPQTFQVLREKFDEILLRHAEKCGARVLEEHRLLDAAFDSDGVTLSFADRLGDAGTMRVGVVVDASGRAGILVKRFGRHEHDPLLLNIAVHAQYEGIPRASGRRAGVVTMLGNEAGVLAWGLAAAFGLSALLVASRVAYDALRILSDLYVADGLR